MKNILTSHRLTLPNSQMTKRNSLCNSVGSFIMENICGIYKITNPIGQIYIGQSRDINNRFKYYKKNTCIKQPLLYKSLNDYGVNNHIFEVICECSIAELNLLEIHYIMIFKSYGTVNGLNMTAGGRASCRNEYKSYEQIKIGRQFTIIKQFKINEQMDNYFDVLEKTYSINSSQFIRRAVEEKLKRDMPEIRKQHQIKLGNIAPF